jgi:hypothetical protein
MLAHSPPFPLVVDHQDRCRDPTAEDEKGVIFELEQRHRVRRTGIWMNASNLKKVIMAMIEVEGPCSVSSGSSEACGMRCRAVPAMGCFDLNTAAEGTPSRT